MQKTTVAALKNQKKPTKQKKKLPIRLSYYKLCQYKMSKKAGTWNIAFENVSAEYIKHLNTLM